MGVAPRRNVVASDGGIFAEQPLHKITGIVQHKDYSPKVQARELRSLLCSHVMRAVAGDEHHWTSWSCHRSSQRGRRSPPDRAPKRLIMKGSANAHGSKA